MSVEGKSCGSFDYFCYRCDCSLFYSVWVKHIQCSHEAFSVPAIIHVRAISLSVHQSTKSLWKQLAEVCKWNNVVVNRLRAEGKERGRASDKGR